MTGSNALVPSINTLPWDINCNKTSVWNIISLLYRSHVIYFKWLLYFDILKYQVNNKMGDLPRGPVVGNPATCHSAHYLVAQLRHMPQLGLCSEPTCHNYLTPACPRACALQQRSPHRRASTQLGRELLLTSTREASSEWAQCSQN